MNRPRNWPVRRTRSEPQSVFTQLPHAVRPVSSKTRTGSRARAHGASRAAISALRLVQRCTCDWPRSLTQRASETRACPATSVQEWRRSFPRLVQPSSPLRPPVPSWPSVLQWPLQPGLQLKMVRRRASRMLFVSHVTHFPEQLTAL